MIERYAAVRAQMEVSTMAMSIPHPFYFFFFGYCPSAARRNSDTTCATMLVGLPFFGFRRARGAA